MIYVKGDKVTASKDCPSKGLTKGKQYEVVTCTGSALKLINDDGRKWGGIGYDLIEPLMLTGKGDSVVIVTSSSSNAAPMVIIQDTVRPIVGQCLLVGKSVLQVTNVIYDIMGSFVVTVRAASKLHTSRSKLL